MRRLLPLLLLLVLAPASARAEGYALEFGPYAGYYDFDRLTAFRDRGLLGLRAGVHVNPSLRLEAEFDEVYTRRALSDHQARQVSLAAHLRYEPLAGRWSPSFMGGAGFVALDDSEDADAFGEAWDVALGLRWRASERWVLRGEWMLRRQVYRIHRLDSGEEPIPVEAEDRALWGRSLRVGVGYVF